jgi:hypothetical protein
MAGNQHTLFIDQHRVGPAPFADRGGDLVEVGLAMQPRIVGVGDQSLDRPTLDPVGRPRPRRNFRRRLRRQFVFVGVTG